MKKIIIAISTLFSIFFCFSTQAQTKVSGTIIAIRVYSAQETNVYYRSTIRIYSTNMPQGIDGFAIKADDIKYNALLSQALSAKDQNASVDIYYKFENGDYFIESIARF